MYEIWKQFKARNNCTTPNPVLRLALSLSLPITHFTRAVAGSPSRVLMTFRHSPLLGTVGHILPKHRCEKKKETRGGGQSTRMILIRHKNRILRKSLFFFLSIQLGVEKQQQTCTLVLKTHLQCKSSSSFPVIYRSTHFPKPALFFKAVTIYTWLFQVFYIFSALYHLLSHSKSLHVIQLKRT